MCCCLDHYLVYIVQPLPCSMLTRLLAISVENTVLSIQTSFWRNLGSLLSHHKGQMSPVHSAPCQQEYCPLAHTSDAANFSRIFADPHRQCKHSILNLQNPQELHSDLLLITRGYRLLSYGLFGLLDWNLSAINDHPGMAPLVGHEMYPGYTISGRLIIE